MSARIGGTHRFRKAAGVVACSIAFAMLSAQAAPAPQGAPAAQAVPAAPVPWPDVSFSYLAQHDPLSKVLTAVGEAFGIRVQLSDGLLAREPLLNGNLTMPTTTEFLNKLATSQGLQWFYYAGVLHVSRMDETVTRVIPVPGMTAGQLKQALTDLGIVDPRFGWAEFAERGVVMVSGPPAYDALVANALSGLPDTPVEQQVRVFKLRHASVDDRTVRYRDAQINTAGIASILRGLISGKSGGGTSTSLVEVAAPIRIVQPLAPLVGSQPADNDGPTNPTNAEDNGKGGGNGSRKGDTPPATNADVKPVILADTLQNAIIIKDRPRNMAIYEQLIAQLDVPSLLVEIEAEIIDVDSTKLLQYGVDWGLAKGRSSVNFSGPALTPTGASASVVFDAGNLLLSRVQALESTGDASVVARPAILTQDNMGALIDLADTVYIQTTGSQSSVVPVTAGVTLRVTPHIVETGGNRSVQLALDIEDGSVESSSGGNATPAIHRSTISTQAVMGENESLLVGGFKAQNKFRRRDGLPILGSLPVVGALFSQTSDTVDKRERMFLITPKIVVPATMAGSGAMSMNEASPAAAKSMTVTALPASTKSSPDEASPARMQSSADEAGVSIP